MISTGRVEIKRGEGERGERGREGGGRRELRADAFVSSCSRSPFDSIPGHLLT